MPQDSWLDRTIGTKAHAEPFPCPTLVRRPAVCTIRRFDVPGFLSGGIFLSYRREDAGPYARLLQFQLRERFPDARVFMDLDSIEAGLDFAEVIREALESCAVLVALVGRQWATLVDENGKRRLDDPADYVRFEIQTALERDVRVIPVLVDGARPLRHHQLPSGLDKLARLNTLELSYGRYQYDAERLLDLIQRVLDSVADTDPAHESPSVGEAAAPTVPHVARVRPDRHALGDAATKGFESLRSDRARVIRILTDAEHVARSITDESTKAWALAEVAEALAATDLDNAVRLIADAKGAAQSITNESNKAFVLSKVAEVLAATDPDGAERVAWSITDESEKASALTQVAEVLVATDPDRATRLIADAERIAQSITDENSKAYRLAAVGQVLAATDPNRATRLIADAERIAQSITDENDKALALAVVAKALAAADPDRVQRIVAAIIDESIKVFALTLVAEVLATTDPDRAVRLIADAERVAQSITDKNDKEFALAAVAEALAATDPDRAEHIAGSITDESAKGFALAAVAKALAATDPDRAERVAWSITEDRLKVSGLVGIAKI